MTAPEAPDDKPFPPQMPPASESLADRVLPSSPMDYIASTGYGAEVPAAWLVDPQARAEYVNTVVSIIPGVKLVEGLKDEQRLLEQVKQDSKEPTGSELSFSSAYGLAEGGADLAVLAKMNPDQLKQLFMDRLSETGDATALAIIGSRVGIGLVEKVLAKSAETEAFLKEMEARYGSELWTAIKTKMPSGALRGDRGIADYQNHLRFPISELDQEGHVILDVGAGDQMLAKQAIERGYKSTVISVEPRLAVGTVESPTLDQNAVAALSQRLSFGTGTVDNVYALHSVPGKLNSDEAILDSFSEILRVLKPGGTARIFPVQYGHEANVVYQFLKSSQARSNPWYLDTLENARPCSEDKFEYMDALGRIRVIFTK